MATQPKLRPLKTEAEIKAIPTDQPVLIELPGAVTAAEPDRSANDVGPAAPQQQHRQAAATPGDGAQTLEQQLQAMKDARAADAQRLADANRERDAALARATAAEQDVAGAEQRAVTTGLTGAQANLTAAQQAFKTAFEAGDAAAMAESQAKIGRFSAQVLQLEQQGAEAAQRVEEAKRQPAAPQVTDPMQAMEQNTGLYPQEKDWFRKHPEAWSDRRMNVRLEDAYHRAMEKGLARGSDAYFAFVDQHMGYAAPPQQQRQHHNGHDDGHDDFGGTMTAAPVSRQNGTMNGNNPVNSGQVILTPTQRQFCADNNISEVAYAQGLVAMQKDKQERPEAYYIPPGRQ